VISEDRFAFGQGISVAVVDDHPLFRDGVCQSLVEDGFEIAGIGGSADDAVYLAETLLPELMLLDLSMPGGGLEAVRRVVPICPVTKLVVLTVSEDHETVMQALKLGASGYILKGVQGEELASILRSIHSGQTYITPALATELLLEADGAGDGEDAPGVLALLTGREREILDQLSSGASNKQIARALDLSEKTVKHHMSNILAKLQVKNRVEAALYAERARGRAGDD